MNSDLLEAQWVQAKEFLRDKWGRLTEDDLRQINGRYDLLIDKLLMRYGYTREQAEEEVRRWNIDKETKPTYGRETKSTISQEKPYARKEERTVRRDDNSSLFKWLLALAIPLLLLAAYFANMKTPETTQIAPGTVQERIAVFSETPADQTIGQMIRQALATNSFQFKDLSNVRLSASNGVVTVSGTVANTQERDRIITILQNINGVKQVNNQLEVRP